MKNKSLTMLFVSTMLLCGCGGNNSQNQKPVVEDKYYTVSYLANGGVGSTVTESIKENTEYTIKSFMFTAPANQEFDSWKIDETTYNPGDKITVTKDTDILAVYKNVGTTKYTVSYDANGGSGIMSSQTFDKGTWFYLPDCAFTAPTDKEFYQWRIDGSLYSAGQAYQVNSDVVVKAEWKDTVPPTPIENWEDDKYYLSDCKCYNMGIPSNKDNPVNIKTTLSADSSSWFNTEFKGNVDNGYRYIYKNSCSDGPAYHKCGVDTYSESHDGGGLKINSTGVGFGSPYFTHTGAKLEFRIGLSSVNNASEKKQEGKDTFHIYYFGENNNYLGKTVIEEGSIDSKTKEIKFYYTEANASQIRFFEFRCIALPYKTNQTYNVGIGYCNVKSWERI